MPGFVAGAQLEVDREVWLTVETTADTVGCPGCRARAVGHGRRWLRVRDLPMEGRLVAMVGAKPKWRCPDPDNNVKPVDRDQRRDPVAGVAGPLYGAHRAAWLLDGRSARR
jgi:hypothetical protein